MDQARILNLLVPVGLIALFYFMLIRPQQKKDKQIKEMRSNLKVGDRITTIGGFQGRILKVLEDTIIIEVGDDKIRLTIEKWGIGKIQTSTED